MKKPKRTKAMPKCVASQPKWVQNAWLQSQSGLKPRYVLRPPVPADTLPGEWVKLPVMKWPKELPARVPANVTMWLRCAKQPTHWFAREIIYQTWNMRLNFDGLDTSRQAAWDETLILLGYTEDA